MGTRSKDKIKAMIAKDISSIYNRCMEVKKSLNDNLEDTLDYLRTLIAQIPQSASGPLITKTPKIIKKKVVQRIETIPENDVINIDDTFALQDQIDSKNIKKEIIAETTITRTKRKASKIAEENIIRQSKLTLKPRKPSNSSDDSHVHKKREIRTKRKKHARSSSSEEDTAQGPAKHSKTEETLVMDGTLRKTSTAKSQNHASMVENTLTEENNESPKEPSTARRSSTRKRTFLGNQSFNFKKPNAVDDTVIAPTGNDIAECSMYEDAIGKPTPIMNSTMNFNSTITLQKMMNATVILEPLSAIKLNETVTISKNHGNNVKRNNEQHKPVQMKTEFNSPRLSKLSSPSSESLQDRMQRLEEAIVNQEFDELLTEDESLPEEIKQGNRKRQKRIIRLSKSSSEDEAVSIPVKSSMKEINTVTGFHETRNTFKSNALFSPYAKESVKKRVEAFEQAGMNSPKLAADMDVPTRLTRTKTRAIAAAKAEAAENTKTSTKTVAHKLARKSLAKAKKISLAKQIKNTDEFKENKVQSAQKVHKLHSVEKVSSKQQQKTTPLNKMKTQLPMSVNRIPHTPSNQIVPNQNKTLSAARTNIITSVESFIHQSKPISKRNSIDKMEEKKRKLNEEDGRKKREEALRLQTEEKRRKRQEKELKNKLAREAKERQDMEKRQKAEKEREEKARLAQQVQEKQREEMERKRLAQLQRAQEKEERRRQEEQQRLLRLQEQEEAERILAEQRRREQEADKRKEAELRAQQQAAVEAQKTKNQMLLTQAKIGAKQCAPTNYVLDSEPDDDESDDESSPKHLIPQWAQSQVRKAQLAIQRYIPDRAIYKFFDTKKCTPDLSQLFQGIDRSRLKRTSSAVWKTPPRYSMMETE
ncbi:Inner centromere protein A [Anthophora plagiata]